MKIKAVIAFMIMSFTVMAQSVTDTVNVQSNTFQISNSMIIIGAIVLCVLSYAIGKAITKRTIINDKKSEYNKLVEDYEQQYKKYKTDAKALLSNYDREAAEVKAVHNKSIEELKDNIDVLEDDILSDIQETFSIFDFEDSIEINQKLAKIKEESKLIIKKENIETNIRISQLSQKQFDRWMKKVIGILLKSFTTEANTIITRCNGSNIETVEESLEKSFNRVNGALTSSSSFINIEVPIDFLRTKVKEARLQTAHLIQKKSEQEEQRAIKAEIREEEKVKAEIEKARVQAERDKRIAEEAISTLQEEMKHLSTEQKTAYEERLKALKEQLEEANEKGNRALSMAQQTKAGHVYIISNIGSFGENVYKIGVTRRLEPMDRIKELSGASVPFGFDVHGMIHSKNAPALEHTLHKAFNDYRVNKVNMRKEFFNVTLNKIQSIVKSEGLTVNFTKLAMAEQYRETLRIENNNA